MASSGSSSLLARSKTTRLNPTSNAKAGPGRPVLAPSSTSQFIPSAAPLSNLELFLANLRILDLDLLEDWPDISVETFSNTASQGQKKRVQCVEWALYQLFVLWDEDEARKFRSFFPPTDHVQSLNLRGALLRCLEQAKKNGVLGRDTVIRKTMLDECKGDRLEEVLAAFSFAVVRKVISEESEALGYPPAISLQFALENRGHAGEITELAVLKLAHQASLSQTLRRKKETRALFEDFSDLLDVKERSIARRREQIKSIDQQSFGHVSDDEKLDVWRLVRNNWAGNERWMETLLYGDANARRDGLLTTPFDKVWRRVGSKRLGELEDHGTGLLEQLEGRVKGQRERLEKWEGLRKRMGGEGGKNESQPASSREGERRKGLGLQFDLHQNLQVGRIMPPKVRDVDAGKGSLNDEYASIVAAFERDLKGAGKGPARPITELLPGRLVDKSRLSAEAPPEEAISELSEMEGEITRAALGPSDSQARSQLLAGKGSLDTDIDYRQQQQSGEPEPFADEQPSERQRPKHSKSYSKGKLRSPSTSPTPPPRKKKSRSPTKAARQPVRRQSLELEEPERQPVSPTQAQADEILASMNTTSPSPTKQSKPRHTLSLAERTRLTMNRKATKHVSSDDEDPVPASKPTPLPTQDENPGAGGYEDLVARTRKSMAGFEAARQKAQLERRKSQRKSKMAPSRREGSYFPKVDEEGKDVDNSMLAEELMEGEQNYADVFMSRPKIQTSPARSPTKEWNDPFDKQESPAK